MNRPDTPFEGFDSVFERMSRGLDLDRPFNDVDVDVRMDEDRVVVSADLPGFDPDDIDVTLDGRTLSISAERTTERDAEAGDYVRRERRHDTVSRTLRLPADVAEDGAEATYNNGVLSVALPRTDEDDGGVDVDVR